MWDEFPQKLKSCLLLSKERTNIKNFFFFFDKFYWFVLILIFIINLNHSNFITKQTDKNG